MQPVLGIQVEPDHAALSRRSKKLLWTGFGVGLALVFLVICVKAPASPHANGSFSLAFAPAPVARPRSAMENQRGPALVAKASAIPMPEDKGVDIPALLAHHLYVQEGLKLDGVDVELLWNSGMMQQLGEEAKKEYVEGVAPEHSNLNDLNLLNLKGLNLVQELQQTHEENWERIWRSPMVQQVRQDVKKMQAAGLPADRVYKKFAAALTASALAMHGEMVHAKSVLGVNGQLDFGPLAGDQPGGEGTGKALGINDTSQGFVLIAVIAIVGFAFSQWSAYQDDDEDDFFDGYDSRRTDREVTNRNRV
jgi:hypothetical protein